MLQILPLLFRLFYILGLHVNVVYNYNLGHQRGSVILRLKVR